MYAWSPWHSDEIQQGKFVVEYMHEEKKKKKIRRMIKIIENDSFSLICFSIMVIYIGTSNHR